ncbi:MAG: DeoR/GlpR family DNA-binding transcription regulator [Actinomycetales bacterium]
MSTEVWPEQAVAGGSMRYDRAPDRRARILETVAAHGFVSVTALAADLGVSDMTIRRDLRRLSAAGEVRVFHGGVSLPHATLRTSEFVSRAESNAEAKSRVSERAAQLVREDDVVAIDAGTTAFGVVTALPPSFRGTVVTHSVPAIQHLLHRPDARLVGLGGELYPPSQAFVGQAAVDQAQHVRVRVLILGAAAVDARGVYAEADVERSVKLALIDAADDVVLVVDSTKFTARASVRLCGLERLTHLVTDAPPPPALRRQLRQDAVEVILAAPATA